MMFDKHWLDPRHVDYHRRQFTTPYRSTVHLTRFLRSILPRDPQTVLDVGCGAGQNCLHIGKAFPCAAVTGVDIASHLFPLGQALILECGGRPVKFVGGDFYTLPNLLSNGSYDLVLSLQTMTWLESYERFLSVLFQMVCPGGWIVISSLFTDCLVDAKIAITEYDEGGASQDPVWYNIYCFDRFVRQCLSLGARQIINEDFKIDVEIPPPAHRRMGTFTRRLAEGELIQQSGPLLMPWKFVAIRL
jgi:ubiquinone/menaquinone biosynthesis C-methylase UbiE